MSSFTPSQAELALVQVIFAKNDPQKLGILTGDVAVKAFQGAQLPPTILGEVWAIADKENNGFLTRKGVAIAIRLIGYAQKGVAVKEALLDRGRNDMFLMTLFLPVLHSGPCSNL